MSTQIIVSYDGTPNDDDALALGRMLARTGASLALAYVRHSREFDPEREQLAQHDAERLLAQGASWLGDQAIPQHVIVSASTGEGLAALAAEERASVIVFGSDYRTAPGHVEPGTSAQRLLEGGPVAIAVAPAGLRAEADAQLESIAVSDPDADGSAEQTAHALAAKVGGSVIPAANDRLDLVVVGSQPGGSNGRIALSGRVRSELSAARTPVLVVPYGTPVLF